MAASLQNGLVTVESKYPVGVGIKHLESLLNERGIKIFARVDHSGEAEKVGLTMRPTLLLIFGNPTGGTPIMQTAPTVAIDLPLKALFWEDSDGRSWLTYNDPEYLQSRHGFPAELMGNLLVVSALLQKAVE
jgi:uncharacterized protein (DUF302 family)